MDRRLVRRAITNAPQPITITCHSSAIFRSTEKLSVCKLPARVLPSLGRWDEESWSSNVPDCRAAGPNGPSQACYDDIARMHNKFYRLPRLSLIHPSGLGSRPAVRLKVSHGVDKADPSLDQQRQNLCCPTNGRHPKSKCVTPSHCGRSFDDSHLSWVTIDRRAVTANDAKRATCHPLTLNEGLHPFPLRRDRATTKRYVTASPVLGYGTPCAYSWAEHDFGPSLANSDLRSNELARSGAPPQDIQIIDAGRQTG